MSYFSQFTGGPKAILGSVGFSSSTTFVAPFTGWYQIFAVGGGGAGGGAMNNSAGSPADTMPKALGGGAGGSCFKTAYITAGASIVITIGTGGTATGGNSVNAKTRTGNSGNITTVVGGGVSLTCNGGAGGTSALNANLGTPTAGGNATGGDVNLTGGAGQSITVNVVSRAYASGGGAVGLFGNGFAGSDITNTSNASPGGGAASSTGNAFNAPFGASVFNNSTFGTPVNFAPNVAGLSIMGNRGSTNSDSNMGASNGASSDFFNSNTVAIRTSGAFAGGTGIGYKRESAASVAVDAGNANFGGGGGGLAIFVTGAGDPNYNANGTAGSGGAGLVQILYLGS